MGMGQIKGSGGSRMVLSEINVTPLVDVMLVLLIMFMVTAPLLQQGLEVDVPQTKGAGMDLKQDPLRIIIGKDKSIKIAKSSIKMTNLRGKLKSILSERKDKQVFIEADQSVDYGFVAQIMTEVKQAGATGLGLITQPAMVE